MPPSPWTPLVQITIALAALSVAAAGILHAVSAWSEEKNARLVEIGIAILKVDPNIDSSNAAIREWALNLIDANAGGVRFSEEARAELLKNAIVAKSVTFEPYDRSRIPINPQASPSFSCEKYITSPDTERSPQEDILCYDKEAADADQKMGQLYQIIRFKMSPNDSVELARQQLEWLKQRDQNCPARFDDLKTPDGKVNLLLLAQKAHCLKLESEKRYTELQKQADLIGSKGDRAQSSKNAIDLSAQKGTEP